MTTLQLTRYEMPDVHELHSQKAKTSIVSQDREGDVSRETHGI